MTIVRQPFVAGPAAGDASVPGAVAMHSRIRSRDGGVIWLTGLSGAGKTTLSQLVQAALIARGIRCEVLDGDVVRAQFSKGLGFSREDRDENIRRISVVALSLAQHPAWVIAAAVSPYRLARNTARQLVESSGLPFLEVYVRCPLEIAEQRDPKGLYKLARAGRIAMFTGISDPYEEPDRPDLIIDTAEQSPEACAGAILAI